MSRVGWRHFKVQFGLKNVFSFGCIMNIQEALPSYTLLELFLNSLDGFLTISMVVCISYALEIFHPMESSGPA